jgi:hypothetical protein
LEGADTPSPGSERRLAWISRIPRGSIAHWEEESLLRLRALTPAWYSRPTGRYRKVWEYYLV